MAHIASGSFFGYRERPPAMPQKRRAVRLYTFKPRTRLAWFHWDLLGPVPYDYRVYEGYASDTFGDYIPIPYMSRMIVCNIRENDAILQFMYNEAAECPERLFELGFARVEAVIAFRIRNAIPGSPAYYQISPMI